jgi:hypothetical protein
MATITIKIELDSAAFCPDAEPEIRRILSDIVEEKTALRHWQTLRDNNGNMVGFISLQE